MTIMRFPRFCALAVLGCLLGSAPAHAQSQATPAQPPPGDTAIAENYHVEFAAGLWATIPATVEFSDTEDNLAGTNIDFMKQLGLSNQPFAEFHLTVRLARKHKLRAQYLPLYYKQSATLASGLNFVGQTYLAGDAVNSTFHWNAWRAEYEYDFITADRGYIGGMVGVGDVNASGALANETQTGSASVQIPMPGIGVVIRYYATPRVSITGEFTGYYLPGGTNGHFIDADGSATVNVSKYFGIQGGYRLLNASYVYSGSVNAGTFTIHGPYIGGTVRY